MNIDQLLDAMADSDPDPHAVLDLVQRKRRAARNRAIYASSGGLAVVVAVLVGVVVHGLGSGAQSSSSASSGAYSSPVSGQAAAPAASGLSPGAASGANGPARVLGPQREPTACTQAALAQMLAKAVRSGASVIVGSATLASGSTAGHATGGSGAYYSVTLRSVHTLAGPRVASGTIAWIAGASPANGSASPANGSASPANGSASAAPSALAPDGQVFGIVYPPGGPGLPGPVLQAAAVVNGQVILASEGCWNTAASPASLPQRLALMPGSSSPGHPASTKISLAAAEKLATGA